MFVVRRGCAAVLLLTIPASLLLAQKELGFDNSRPSGQPYLTPEESLKRMHVPPEFEVKLFAAEPDIINPVAFTIDERGRLWVVECYEYPRGTPKGQKPRDRIKILEDTTGRGFADRVTVWADGKELPIGFNLATGIEVGRGGAFLGAAPYLFHLRDTKGTGRCNEQSILLEGFGSQDTHETLNTLQWGPDGGLYGLQGIFTQSKVNGVRLNAAVWRYQPDARRFEVFAEGTSNPWGLDFDAHGQAFLTACVIPHAFHIVPGGVYIRQAGGSQNPYAYGQLREISDHLHHRESGWAHAGALVLEGEHVPAAYRNSLLMGSIHGCSIKRDILERRGSTFVAHHAPDFLVSGDKNFRPINLRWGPDGAIYIIDWHDQNPCHQARADSWDMTHGRIYKIQFKGAKGTAPGDLGRRPSRELVELLKNDNPWCYRTALRLLAERRDGTVAPLLEARLFEEADETRVLRYLWGLHAVGSFTEPLATRLLDHPSQWVRAWAIRLLGEAGQVSAAILNRLTQLARTEPAPEVRSQLASTAMRLSRQDTLPLLHHLLNHAEDRADPNIPLLIWLAYEPHVSAERDRILDWLKEHAGRSPLAAEAIVARSMRRLAATGAPQDLAAAITFVGAVRPSSVRRQALEGLVLALENQQTPIPSAWSVVYAKLQRDSDQDVRRLASRLAVSFGDSQAARRALTIARGTTKSSAERCEAIRDLAVTRPLEGLDLLENLVAHDSQVDVRVEACRALSNYERVDIAAGLLAGWVQYPPELRAEVVNLLASRREWARELLAAVGQDRVPRTSLNDHTILRIRALHDPRLDAQIEAVWGRVRDTPADLEALINKMRQALQEGPATAERGRKVFETQCAKCHRFEGRGHDVGPNLDGAARDIEYLLVNVLDPNRVVGQPYYTRFVALKNGRVETGLLAAEDDHSVTLKGENEARKIIQKKDIEEVTVQPKSLMPEGLDKSMNVQDFRDLVRYLMVNPFLTEVARSGPFDAEKSLPITPGEPFASKEVTWERPPVGVTGRIPLPAASEPRPMTAVIAANLLASESQKTRLLLGTNHPVQVWLNGKLIYRGQPAQHAAAPDQASIDVTLRAGRNALVLQVTYQGSEEGIYARLLDPQRHLQNTNTPR